MSKLFTPITLGNINIKNRFVRSATHDWLGNPDGTISSRELELYKNLAKGGVGLIISAHSYVEHPRGRASVKQNGIYDDTFIPGYAKVCEIVHKYDSKFIVQISHSGVQTNTELTEGMEPADPNKMTEEEIVNVIDAFAKAAYRVKMAGCDGVQFHLAHGYLLSRFLSPSSNKREDKWGGTLENRMRIVAEIIKKAKALVGDEYPVLVKLNSEGGFEGTAALSLDDVTAIALELEKLGVCAIELSGGVTSEKANSMSRVGISSIDKEAYFAKSAKAVKKVINIPLILVGGIRSREVMDKILDEGIADMISLSRPFVREPDLVKKIEGGQSKVSCISCNLCRDFSGLKCNCKN